MDQATSQYTSAQVLRCSQCRKAVEVIANNGQVSTENISASGMVKFGYNLYYCEKCSIGVGYKQGQAAGQR